MTNINPSTTAGDPPFDPNQTQPPPGNGAAPPVPEDQTTEAFARRLGWRPEAEFAGAPASRRPKEFLTPEQYIAKVETEVPIMRDRLRRQDSTIVGLNGKVDEFGRKLEETSTVIKQMHESQKTIREREYRRARADLESEMDAAAAIGDTGTYADRKGKIVALDAENTKPVAEPPPPPGPQRIPEVETWADANPWFRASVVLNQAAIEHEAALPRTVPLAERLETTAEWVAEKFATVYPQYFPNYRPLRIEEQEPPLAPPAALVAPRNPRRAAASTVGAPAGGNGPVDTGALTYDKLNMDEKTHCDYLVRTVKGFTQEDFLRDYKR